MKLSDKNELIIAAAGAGKTWALVDHAIAEAPKKIMITTYTDNNTQEIRNVFYEKLKYIPSHVTIMPWFTMLLRHFVRPYQGTMSAQRVLGLNLVNQKSAPKFPDSKTAYWGDENIDKCYFDDKHKIFSDKISRFAFRCNEKSNGAVIERFSIIFDAIFIDEVQDLAGYDLELIKLLLKTNMQIKLIGDPRQVAYNTHDESKNEKYYGSNFSEYFKKKCGKNLIHINEDSLNSSRRCVSQICEFADKLYPNLKPTKSENLNRTEHDGVFFIKKKDIAIYLEKFVPMQLRWNIKSKANTEYDVMNLGISKGKSFERVLIYPTKPMLKWLVDNNEPLNEEARAKFYIGITRARQSVGIVVNEKKYERKINGIYWTPIINNNKNEGMLPIEPAESTQQLQLPFL